MSRRATIVKHLTAGGLPFILVDGGDSLFSGSVPDVGSDARCRPYVEKARVIVAAYNAMGYRALAVGDTELSIGVERLKELRNAMSFPLLCANLVDAETGRTVFSPSTVTEAGGVKVGIFAVIMNTLNTSYLARVAPGVKLIDGVEAGRKAAEALRPRVDLVLGLCHSNDDEIERLLADSPAVDIVVRPHAGRGTHRMWIQEDEYLEWIAGRAVLGADGQGSRIGRFDIALGRQGAPFVPWAEFQAAYEKKQAGEDLGTDEKRIMEAASVRHLGGVEVIPVFPHFAEAPGIEEMVGRFTRSSRYVAVDFEQAQREAKDRYVTALQCKECHDKNYAAWRGTRHGRAYETLEATGDHLRYDCVPCHTLGYGVTFVDARAVGPYQDVQCESCHGTNPAHAADPRLHAFGPIRDRNCLVCHNPDHLGQPFDFAQKRLEDSCCAVTAGGNGAHGD